MAQHNEYGEEAEEYAAKMLAQKGYRILARNWKAGKKELDIVAEFGEELVVVEVKARATNYFEEPQNAVDKKKRKHTVAAANEYILQYEIDLPVRYDIVAVTGAIQNPKVEHIEDAFIPTL